MMKLFSTKRLTCCNYIRVKNKENLGINKRITCQYYTMPMTSNCTECQNALVQMEEGAEKVCTWMTDIIMF